MRLYLLRHAEAAPGIPDAGRALTERGRAQVDRMVELMDWSFVAGLKQVEHSGLLRARQTAEQLLERLGSKVPVQVRPGIRPNDEPVMIGLDLATCKDDRFLVGHNPHLARLAGLLLARGGSEVNLVVKKAGYLAMERVRPADKENPFGQWALLWMISPGRLASRKA
jgi:phosphohistidine phosphatase